MILIILIVVVIISLIFRFSFHSLRALLIVLTQSIILSLLILTNLKHPLISFRLILSYSRGILVVFAYILNISPNPNKFFNFNYFIIFFIMFFNFIKIDINNTNIFCIKNDIINIYLDNSSVSLIFVILILFLSILSRIKITRKYCKTLKFN